MPCSTCCFARSQRERPSLVTIIKTTFGRAASSPIFPKLVILPVFCVLSRVASFAARVSKRDRPDS